MERLLFLKKSFFFCHAKGKEVGQSSSRIHYAEPKKKLKVFFIFFFPPHVTKKM